MVMFTTSPTSGGLGWRPGALALGAGGFLNIIFQYIFWVEVLKKKPGARAPGRQLKKFNHMMSRFYWVEVLKKKPGARAPGRQANKAYVYDVSIDHPLGVKIGRAPSATGARETDIHIVGVKIGRAPSATGARETCM
jgi:hypothetical protein